MSLGINFAMDHAGTSLLVKGDKAEMVVGKKLTLTQIADADFIVYEGVIIKDKLGVTIESRQVKEV
jgi:hypothetical protein